MINLDWIDELIKQMPETSKYRKNLIEIAGYPSWENVNSNLLAFYLDEKEEHNFGRLFLDSLLDLCEIESDIKLPTRETFDTEFVVSREVSSSLGGRIDIVIKSDSENDSDAWAIIIENKLYANLYNNLDDYYHSIKPINKIGILLTLEKNIKNDTFINISHKDLVERIKQSLSEYYLGSDDRHLLFLKEYILNVESHYTNKNHMANFDNELLQLFHSKNEEIQNFKNTDEALLSSILECVDKIMENKGFSISQGKNAKWFYVDKEKVPNDIKVNVEVLSMFRFWINVSKLRYENKLEGVFELYGKNNTTHGEELKKVLEQNHIYSENGKNVSISSGGKDGGGFKRIFSFNLPIGDFSVSGFPKQLEQVFTEQLFETGFIERAVSKLEKIIETK